MLRHAEAKLNGLRLHYVTAGSGPLLLFAHGFPEYWGAWQAQLAAFADSYQVVAPDLRGYNLSDKPVAVEQYRMPYLIEDLRALADQLGHDRFTLIGHDWGGVIAWAFALAHPDRLDRLAIINAPHPAIFGRELRDNPAQQAASRYLLLFRSSRAEATLAANDFAALDAAVLADGLARGYFTEADRVAYHAVWSQPGALTGGLNYYRAAGVGPPTNDAPAGGRLAVGATSGIVRVPTLVIWGERDEALLPGNLDGLAAYVPDLTIRRIPDAGHWVVHEKPDIVNQYLREFFASSGEVAPH